MSMQKVGSNSRLKGAVPFCEKTERIAAAFHYSAFPFVFSSLCYSSRKRFVLFRETLGHYHIRCDVLHGAKGHVGARMLHAHLDELLPHIKPRPRDLSLCIGVFVLRMSSGAVSNSGLLVFAGRLISLTAHATY